MLPDKLSYNLASLKKGAERFALSVVTEIDDDGLVNFEKLDILYSIIQNDEKLNYNAVDKFLNGDN